MRKRDLFAATALVAAGLLQGCAGGMLGGHGSSDLRRTNVEVRVISQSCFQGEVVPCG